MSNLPLRDFDSRIPLLRAELTGQQPMGSTYAPEHALLVAMAEEIRALHQRVDELETGIKLAFTSIEKIRYPE